jgi:hypothetical protein
MKTYRLQPILKLECRLQPAEFSGLKPALQKFSNGYFVLCAILLTLFAAACQPKNPLIPEPGVESMKGYELYSWEKDGEWYFSILVGTNREKTLDEIQSADATLQGVDELTAALKSIPAGQYITWSAFDPLAFPPDDLILQVKEICKDQGLELGIAKELK